MFALRSPRHVLAVAAAVAGALVAQAASATAATVTYSGSLTAASQTFARPSNAGIGLPTMCMPTVGSPNITNYNAQFFNVGTTGTYDMVNVSNTFTTTNPQDSYFALYQGSFDPASPLTNLVYANDDLSASIFRSEINCTLTAGTNYILVTSTFDPGATGDFTNQISGPGAITLAPVAVTMRSLRATATRRGILVRWRTASEVDVLGFNVYRRVQGRRVRANHHLIGAHGAGSYSFLDRRAHAGHYWVQLVNVDGSRTWYGPARVAAGA
jgi:hypothetical protein